MKLKFANLFEKLKMDMKSSNLFKKLRKERQRDAAENLKERTYLADSKQKIGWVSPSYTKSRTVRLDPNLLERNRCVAMLSDVPEIDSYKVLRQQILQRTREQGGNVIMVTSALPGEGKTLTAINLAFTFARKFEQTALLVDCDLRRQNIHEVLGFESDKGLVDYLLDECAMTDLIVWPGIEKLTVISGGKTIYESSEILGSPRMKDLLAEMKSRYPDRYVIFDVPPILAGADAMTFSHLVDHVLIVVQADKTPMTDLKKALYLIPQDKIVGLVLNRSADEKPEYYGKEYLGRKSQSAVE